MKIKKQRYCHKLWKKKRRKFSDANVCCLDGGVKKRKILLGLWKTNLDWFL